jgi:hypothetical protein
MKTRNEKPFIVSGEHSQVTSCTLPPGLPKTIIKQMVLEFAGRLRKELVRLQQTNKVVPSRVRSTDSRRLSLDSGLVDVSNCTFQDPTNVAAAYQNEQVSG